MRPRFFRFLPCLPLIMMLMGGCHEQSPSADPESSNPIVPPFASGLIEAPAPDATAHAGAGGSNVMAIIQQARERVNKNPKDVQALIFLANANYDVQRYQEAEGLYRRALELDPENVQVRTDLSTALYRLGRPKEAVEELQRALAIDYHHETALYNLGMIKLVAFDDREGAITAWTQLKEATKDPQLVAKLDQMITQVRQAPPKTSPPSSNSPKEKGAATTGTVLQLPANPHK